MVIWLHPYSYNRGYDTGGNNTDTFLVLAKQGFVVLAFDMVGMGMRVTQGGARFYQAHGANSSLLAQHIADTRALLRVVQCLSPRGRADRHCSRDNRGFTWPTTALNAVPVLDAGKVTLSGFSLGGMVALHVAALEPERVAAVCAVAAFTPMRSDTADRPTGGLRRFSHMHGLVPMLGLFLGAEESLPYDYQDLLGAIAPRPALLLTPKRDRDANFSDVTHCIDEARGVWEDHNASRKLTWSAPDDYSRLSMEMTNSVVDWALGTNGPLGAVAASGPLKNDDAGPAPKFQTTFHAQVLSGDTADTNGPLFFNGWYHLFAQYRPGNSGHPHFWYHWASQDSECTEHP